jgi:hypothetical protein
MSLRPLPLLVVALTALGLVGVACTLNPQPLPPGDDRETTSATPTPTEDPSGGTSFGNDGGSPAPKDAGSVPDAGPIRDAAPPPTDGATDASDASTDATVD